MNTRRLIVLAISICSLAFCIGCQTTTPLQSKISFDPGVASSATRPCPVALSLTEKFTTTEHVLNRLHTPFGSTLRKYAVYVAQSVFGDVQVLEGQPPRSDVKLLLVPRVTNLDIVPFYSPVMVSSGNLGVRWDFMDPKTGQRILSMGIQSEASQIVESAWQFDGAIPQVADGLMSDLTAKTIQRFNLSQDIQRLTGH